MTAGRMPDSAPDHAPDHVPDHALDETLVRSIVEAGLRRYFASRRAKIEAFVDSRFSWRGALAVNARGQAGKIPNG